MLSSLAVLCAVSAVASSWAPAGARGALYIASALALGAVMLAAAWGCARALAQPRSEVPRIILLGGVACRLVLFPAAPYTTHDVDRYLWDGAAFARGVDVWRVPPNDKSLAALRERLRAPVENEHLPTIYPPLAVGLFAAVSLLGPTAARWVWKALVTLASLLLLVATARLLRALGAEARLPLIAFAPLPVLEAGVGAHLDLLSAALTAVGLLFFATRRSTRAGFVIGAATAVKLLPLLAVAPLFIACERRKRLRFALAAAALPVASYGAAFLLGHRPIGSLPLFFEKWRFGSLVYPWLEPWLDSRMKLLGGAIVLSCLGVALLRARKDALSASSWAMAGPLLGSPVVFPWYLAPLSAGAAARPSFTLWSALLLAPLTYEVIDRFDVDQSWNPEAWPLGVLAVVMAFGAVLDVWRCRLPPQPA